MRPAIRVAKRTYKGFVWHWLLDPERTFCGLKPAELNVVEQVDRETLPSVEACRGCERAVDGWDPPQKVRADHVTSSSRPGRVRTRGSLSHGFRTRSGRRLG